MGDRKDIRPVKIPVPIVRKGSFQKRWRKTASGATSQPTFIWTMTVKRDVSTFYLLTYLQNLLTYGSN